MLIKRNPENNQTSFVKKQEELIKHANIIKNVIKLNRLNIFKQKKEPTQKKK
jgi:hypothetical protein